MEARKTDGSSTWTESKPSPVTCRRAARVWQACDKGGPFLAGKKTENIAAQFGNPLALLVAIEPETAGADELERLIPGFFCRPCRGRVTRRDHVAGSPHSDWRAGMRPEGDVLTYDLITGKPMVNYQLEPKVCTDDEAADGVPVGPKRLEVFFVGCVEQFRVSVCACAQ